MNLRVFYLTRRGISDGYVSRRTSSQIQLCLLPDATVSAPWCIRVCSLMHSSLLPCASLARSTFADKYGQRGNVVWMGACVLHLKCFLTSSLFCLIRFRILKISELRNLIGWLRVTH